jgi:two-component system chemotaxis sensor kinase CheA
MGAHMGTENQLKYTVLVADDEECLLSLIRIYLEQEGYLVLASESAPEALRIAKEYAGNIDALITDMRMPRMDGATLSNEFLKLYPRAAVVCMSAYASEELIAQVPYAKLLSKPFSLDHLSELLEEGLFRGVSTESP